MINSRIRSNDFSFALLLIGSSLLTACGGGGSSTPSTASTDPGTATGGASAALANQASASALTISGTPVASIAAGRSYSFTPTVNQAGEVSFSIANKPAWATFSTATGSLTGTPTPTNVGTFSNIVITASNGAANAALAAFEIAVTQAAAASGSATLAWSPPTANTDGSSVSNLAGYNIYYGTSKESMTTKIPVTNPGLTAYTVADLGAGTYFFGISAFTVGGVESAVSVVGSKTIG
jgi:hypothetical protein